MAGLHLNGVEKAFGSVKIIHGVELSIDDGEFVVFVGPSGCGKSTLLRLIAGLEEVTDGTIAIGDTDVTHIAPSDRGVAMVFQSYALYPHMTVAENMGFGLKINKVPRSEREAKVASAAKILHLEELLNRKPKQLSGGQRQRVAIGRAIVRDPKVFLFDEPLSNLDAELRVQMRMELAKLHASLKSTMIYVTHDQVEAMTLADKIVVLRAGRIEQVGKPIALYEDPDNLFVAGFIGSPKMNFLDAIAGETKQDGVLIDIPGLGIQVVKNLVTSVASGTPLKIGIRPEDMSADGMEKASFKIDLIENLGGQTFVYATSADSTPFTLDGRDFRTSAIGEIITAGFHSEKLVVFDRVTEKRIR